MIPGGGPSRGSQEHGAISVGVAHVGRELGDTRVLVGREGHGKCVLHPGGGSGGGEGPREGEVGAGCAGGPLGPPPTTVTGTLAAATQAGMATVVLIPSDLPRMHA